MVVMLRSVDVNDVSACGFLVRTFLACRFQAGHLRFICHEDSARFSTLKVDGWVCDAFRACRSIAAACGAEQWVRNIFTPQLHTLQTMKSWAGPGNKARYEQVEPSGLAVLEQLNVESNSEHNQHLSSTLSNSHYLFCTLASTCQATTTHTTHTIRIPSTQYTYGDMKS